MPIVKSVLRILSVHFRLYEKNCDLSDSSSAISPFSGVRLSVQWSQQSWLPLAGEVMSDNLGLFVFQLAGHVYSWRQISAGERLGSQW